MLSKITGMGIVVLLVGALIGGTAYILLRPDDGQASARLPGEQQSGRAGRQADGTLNELDGNDESGGQGNTGQGGGRNASLLDSTGGAGQGSDCETAGRGGGQEVAGQDGGTGSGGNGYRGGQDKSAGAGSGQVAPGPWDPEALAEDKDWLTISGTVVEAGDSLILETDAGQVEVELGQSRYVEAQGVTFQVGDELQITGFYEDEDVFTAGYVENLTTGQALTLRDESGRPLWAGRGRQGAGTY